MANKSANIEVSEVIEDAIAPVENGDNFRFTDLLGKNDNEDTDENTDTDGDSDSDGSSDPDSSEEPDQDSSGEEEEEADEVNDGDKADIKFIQDNKERIVQLLELERKLMDKDSFTEVVQALVKGVAKMHGVEPDSLFGSKKEDFDDEEEGGFETAYESEIYEKAKRAALKQFKTELNPLQEKLSRLEQAEQERSAKQKMSSEVEQGYDTWSKRIEKETGFKPSRSQVERALSENPSMEPIKAIKLAYMDDILKMTSKNAARSAPKAPTLVNRSVNGGKTQSTGKSSFSDLLREAREQNS